MKRKTLLSKLFSWGQSNKSESSHLDENDCLEEDKYPEEGNYFLLLKDKNTISLNTFENDCIKEIKIFTFGEGENYNVLEETLFTTDKKTKVAILDTNANNILLYDIQSSNEITVSMPFYIKEKAILLHNDNLFIGGGDMTYGNMFDDSLGDSMLFQYNIQREKWFQLETPHFEDRKAIDDLVVSNNMLIAIDNVVYPKYVFFYHLNSTDKLEYSHFKELKSNNSYEEILKGRITPKYFGILTRAFNIGTSFNYISIYNNLDDWTSNFAISLTQREENYYKFNDFLIVGNKLFVASKENGLGVFEIKSKYFIKDKKESSPLFTKEISASLVSYTAYKYENIIKLTQIPNTAKIVLSIKDINDKIRNEIIET